MRHRLGWLAAMVLAVVSIGCGPGTGGTGTGTSALASYGATPASVCGSPIAAALHCPAVAAPSASPGTGTVTYVEAGGTARAVFAGNEVRFAAAADTIRFDGEWGTAAVGSRYFGWVTISGTPGERLASLAVEPSASGTLIATLRDGSEAVLAGPLELRRGP